MIKPQLLPCTPACGYKFHALAVYLHPTLTAHPIRGAFGIQSNIFGGAFSIVNVLRLFGYFRRRAPSWMFDRILNATLPFTPKFATFPGMFRRSPEYLATFAGMFGDIPQNIWWHSPECLVTFPDIFGDIPQNIWWNSPECLATFPGLYNILPIPRVPRIPFPVPVFLVLYIAPLGSS